MAFEFEFIGGDPSVDLVNTTFHRAQPGGADELLTSGEQARRWFMHAGLINEADAADLDTDSLLHSTTRLRSALDGIYRPLARGSGDDPAQQRGLHTLNAVLNQGREQVQLRREEGRFVRQVKLEVIGPPDPNVLLARRAAELLGRLEPRRLKECENPVCDLLFYDDSRNNSRRWCRMNACGNQQKQVRFRNRSTSGSAREAREG